MAHKPESVCGDAARAARLAHESLDQVADGHARRDGVRVDDQVRRDALCCERHVLLRGKRFTLTTLERASTAACCSPVPAQPGPEPDCGAFVPDSGAAGQHETGLCSALQGAPPLPRTAARAQPATDYGMRGPVRRRMPGAARPHQSSMPRSAPRAQQTAPAGKRVRMPAWRTCVYVMPMVPFWPWRLANLSPTCGMRIERTCAASRVSRRATG